LCRGISPTAPSPVATREEVGTVASNPPIRIEPAVAGTFTWLSQRSGVFVPTAPPPLDAGLVVTIRFDLRDLNGKPIGQAFRAVLKTPPRTSEHAVGTSSCSSGASSEGSDLNFETDGSSSPTDNGRAGARPYRDRRIFDERAAYLLADMLSDNQARAGTFGFRSILGSCAWPATP
jgi:hypothetical protein